RFMAALKSSGVFHMEHIPTLDISPILDHFRSMENTELNMADLARKLCWLLGVCAFLRPDDIGGIDVSQTIIQDTGILLTIVFPKERRDGQRIIKKIPVRRHPTDKRLCPVEAYLEYTDRIKNNHMQSGHHKDASYKITPLIRFSKDLSRVLRVSSIGVYMSEITKKIRDLPSNKPPPKPRAIGSTLAAMAGVATQDIMVQGNWSSPKVFERHYRISSNTSSNFTSVVLGSL
ncbi:hypothetical protein BGX27_006030, partial [Mortierella sp. AM989]